MEEGFRHSTLEYIRLSGFETPDVIPLQASDKAQMYNSQHEH